MKKTIIGIMGPGHNTTLMDLDNAYELGKAIAMKGWVLLTGGISLGVMDAASKGAKSVGGLTIGVLPSNDTMALSEYVDIPILTDLGHARNNINVLSSDVVIACGMGPGTASEIALAIKNHKKVIILNDDPLSQDFFQSLAPENIFVASKPDSAMELVEKFLS